MLGCLQDVLVATDVASKGLDFPDIQHVINFDMPDEIENYVRFTGFRATAWCNACLVCHALSPHNFMRGDRPPTF
jgi:Helicase conserved C-terminal domain